MLSKPPADVTEGDLDALVQVGIAESRTMEYKRTLPSGTDKDKREFCADLSSFANAGGGYLIYGVEARDGVPVAIRPVIDPQADKVMLHLDQVGRSYITPRLTGVQTAPVAIAAGGYCLVMHVPPSWSKPHALLVNDAFRFYSRNAAGKYLLDISEIGALFGLAESTRQRIENFRAERIMRIAARETPMPLAQAPVVVLHFVPMGAFARGATVEVREFAWKSRVGQLQTIAGGFTSWRYNFDGLFTYYEEDSATAMSYVQVFRSGVIEAADTYCVSGRVTPESIIPITTFEQKLISALPNMLEALRFLGAEPPVFLMMTLLGVKGHRIHGGVPIDRDMLALPETVIESLDADPGSILKPLIDAVWNASGHERSPNFDIEGRYFPPRS